MKHLIILFISMIISFTSFADEIDDLFEQGEDIEYQFERFSDRNIMTAISHDAGVACKKGLCTLSSVDTKYSDFTINVGGNAGNSNNNSYGGYGNNNGGNFPSITFNNNSDPTEGDTIRYNAQINMTVKVGKCTRSVNVPRAVYYSINRYIYGLMHEDGTTRRSFTPADEAMILFYSTVMKMSSGCGGGGR